MGKYKNLLNCYGFLCILTILLQQGVVALSTYLIILSIQSIEDAPESTYFLLSSFVASLIFVYFPYTLFRFFQEKWKFRAFYLFMMNFSKFTFGNINLNTQKNKEKNQHWITNEGLKIYEEVIDCISEVTSSFLNYFLSMLVIGFMLDVKIIAFYAVAIAFILLSKKLSTKYIERGALGVQDARSELNSVLLSTWPNIVLGNQLNFKLWEKKFTEKLFISDKNHVNYEFLQAAISSISVICATFVIVAGNVLFIMNSDNNPTVLASLIVTLPRQLQIIQSLFYFYNIYMSWKGIRVRLFKLIEFLSLDKNENLRDRINFEKISIFRNGLLIKFATLDKFLDELTLVSCARYTILGQNGCGKSSLMMLIKQTVVDNVFFLPADSSGMYFANEDILYASSGYRKIFILDELMSDVDINVFLLDEWDAHLDEMHCKEWNISLDNLGRKKLVIDILHSNQIIQTQKNSYSLSSEEAMS